MEVRIIVGAQTAYACIKTDGASLDVQLSPGKSAAQSLREYSYELGVKVARLERQAALVCMAIAKLEQQPA